MGTVTSEPIVHLTSNTLAHIHVAGEVDEVFASTEEGLRGRIVESIRQLAASAGEPVTAIVVDGDVRWPLIVHPDGAFIEATALAEHVDGEPAPAPHPVRTGEVPVLAEAAAAAVAGAVAEVPASVEEPAPVEEPARVEVPASVEAPVTASVAEPVPAPVAAQLEPAAAPAGHLRSDLSRSDLARRESAHRDPAQRATPTVEDLLNSRADRTKPRATEGWQGAVRRATGGAISPRPGKAEQSRLDRERTVQRRLDASRTIVVLNPKGGAHKTTSTLLLAATFGTQRGGATLAWDNNETRGTLGWRAQNAPHHRTAVDLLEHLDQFTEPSQASLAALDTYVRTQVDARFDVLASDEDAAASSTIDAAAFDRLHGVLSRYYRLLIVDTGNNMRASNWVAAVAAADQLVIVSTVREDTAASAAWLLDGLREKGFDAKIDDAVTILAAPSAKPDRKLAERLERHFSQVTGDVVHVPFDPALVDGGPIDFDALSPESRDAWLTAAAAIAERL
ncbi:chromosome partitioning protein [Microbacterium aurum]|uniref:Chromosome partitioning protein n=1 Tax=Microbacterium aurum TaxID=36805 RepID=A0A1P8U4D1_9MICO|nr:chromosome partitioning protein [Microbacterium aurum]APZ32968.1 chromosome partitioning protein [Microbacterium aurum]MBM7826507.1 MinD-like ATPase involved in chromosome partitioning or flagellar assembly [Microbacterium aurum]